MIYFCLWDKKPNTKGTYRTSCGETLKTTVRGQVYCPFCGEYVLMNGIKGNKEEFHKRYYQSELDASIRKYVRHDVEVTSKTFYQQRSAAV